MREVKDPTSTRLREGDAVMTVLAGSLKANLVLFSNFGTAYVTRFNDVPASTGYGDPVQKLFKFDDGERVVGALSLDTRLWRPEKLLGVTKHRPGHALPARAAHRRSPPAPAVATRRRARATRSSACSRWRTRTWWRCSPSAPARWSARWRRSTSWPARAAASRVIKVEEGDRVVDFLVAPQGKKDAGITFETQKGRKLTLHPAQVRGDGPRRQGPRDVAARTR